MSWIEKNYEKAALGGAAVVALGVVYLGWSKLSSVETEFNQPLTGTGNSTTAVKDADLVAKALAGRKAVPIWIPEKAGERPVDLFTGIPLFVAASAPEEPVDLVEDGPVHAGIENTWWIQHGIDPGYADSPARDPDGDGFSNAEEYAAKTDPNDPKDFPPLIAKLHYAQDESLVWLLNPRYGIDGKFPINYEDSTRAANKTGSANPVGPGDLFFAEGAMKNRFKFLGSEVRKELNPRTKIELDVTFIRIEDQRANKKGKTYEFPAPLNEQRKNEYAQYDRTAVLSLEALGHSGKNFKVEENTTFALPPDSARKNYLLKEVTPDSITIEMTTSDGEKKTYTAKKGSTAQPAQ